MDRYVIPRRIVYPGSGHAYEDGIRYLNSVWVITPKRRSVFFVILADHRFCLLVLYPPLPRALIRRRKEKQGHNRVSSTTIHGHRMPWGRRFDALAHGRPTQRRYIFFLSQFFLLLVFPIGPTFLVPPTLLPFESLLPSSFHLRPSRSRADFDGKWWAVGSV